MKRLVAMLIIGMLSVSIMGCGGQNNTSDSQEDVEALQSEIESLRAQLDEKEESKEENAESSLTEENNEEKDQGALESQETDIDISTEYETEKIDLDLVYDALEEWTEDNEYKLRNAVYWKCVLLDNDEIPEVVLFNEYTGLYAILSVDEKYKVTFIDTINVDGKSLDPTDTVQRGYWTHLDRFSVAADTQNNSDSQSFSYNPYQGVFACHYTTPSDGVHYDQTMNEYLELYGTVIKEVGNSGTSKPSTGETMYYAGKFGLGEATKDIYEEYNSDFEYSESFVVKDDCKISLKAAFNEYVEANQ